MSDKHERKRKDRNSNSGSISPKHKRKHTSHRRKASLSSVPVKSKQICAHCGKVIRSERLEALGTTFHPDHFLCCGCGKGINDYYVLNDEAFCKKCYQERTCDKCAHCGKPITEDKLVAMGKSWHAKHFCCFTCKKPFGQATPFCEKDGKAYCEKDFNNAFMPKCASCNKSILDGSCISALGKKWHPEHFCCTVCNVAIDVGSPVYVRQGKPYCANDCPKGEDDDEALVAPATSKISSRMKRTLSFNKTNKINKDKTSNQPSPLGRKRSHTSSPSVAKASKRKRTLGISFKKKVLGKKDDKSGDDSDECESDDDWYLDWDNSAEFGRAKWPDANVSDENPLLIEDAPGYHRELGGEYEDMEYDLENYPVPATTSYYREFMHPIPSKEHYIVADDPSRPIIITIAGKKKKKGTKELIFRAMVRTIRGDERILLRCKSDSKSARLKALRNAYPQLADAKISEVKETTGEKGISEALAEYEQRMFTNCYKMGILYCRKGQAEENEMYNNTKGSEDFEEFLNYIGERVQLKGFTGFRGGLNVTEDLTGSHSVYTGYRGFEIMFHVSTLIPFTEEDEQQVERKRHLGNDVVLLVYRDRGCKSFDPSIINSQYNHVFCVIEDYDDENIRIGFTCKQGVRPSMPPLPAPAIFPKDEKLRNWILSKLVASEQSAMVAQQFSIPLRRTRRQLLQEIVHTYGSN